MQEPTRIIAIRHGETDWNAQRRIQGHTDIPLNAVGHQQSRLLAQVLTDSPIHHVYSSDLLRAAETAEAIAAPHGAPVARTPQLRERHFGAIEGSSFIDFEQHYPQDSLRWRKRDPAWAPPGGGESLLTFQERVAQEVQALAAQNIGNQIAIVTHGGVLDVLYRQAARLGLQDARTWQLTNTAVNRLLWSPEGGLGLVGWADVSHLEDASLDESTT